MQMELKKLHAQCKLNHETKHRLEVVSNSVVSEAQCVFIPGCLISDNIIISSQVMYLKRKMTRNNDFKVLKLELVLD